MFFNPAFRFAHTGLLRVVPSALTQTILLSCFSESSTQIRLAQVSGLVLELIQSPDCQGLIRFHLAGIKSHFLSKIQGQRWGGFVFFNPAFRFAHTGLLRVVPSALTQTILLSCFSESSTQIRLAQVSGLVLELIQSPDCQG